MLCRNFLTRAITVMRNNAKPLRWNPNVTKHESLTEIPNLSKSNPLLDSYLFTYDAQTR